MTRRHHLELWVDSVLCSENAEVQHARCNQIYCQIGAALIVERGSSMLVMVQQLRIAAKQLHVRAGQI